MTENALVIRDEMSLQDTMTLGSTLAKSGYFDDAKDAAKAVVKILAGREMGFGPISSMTGISVIKGKVAVGANLMAAAVKGDPRYDYRVIEMTPERCDLVFFERGVEVGHSTFTIEEARAAGVGSAKPPGKPNTMLNMFPRNMLFARAMSNGMRWYCPNATGGAPIYTPEELGATVDGEGEVVTVPSRVVQPPRDANQSIAEAYGTEHAADVAEAQREIADLEPHWMDRVDKEGLPIRPQFWKWVKAKMALTDADAYTALEVEHIHDYAGTLKEAMDRIEEWAAEQSGQKPKITDEYHWPEGKHWTNDPEQYAQWITALEDSHMTTEYALGRLGVDSTSKDTHANVTAALLEIGIKV